jgi:hypothetical protein
MLDKVDVNSGAGEERATQRREELRSFEHITTEMLNPLNEFHLTGRRSS